MSPIISLWNICNDFIWDQQTILFFVKEETPEYYI